MRYHLLPQSGEHFVPPDVAKTRSPGFLVKELDKRVVTQPVRFDFQVQIAAHGDSTVDPSKPWHSTQTVTVGSLEISGVDTEREHGGDLMSSGYGRPTAAELVAAVADFLEADAREATIGQVNFHSRVAGNALHMVERELLANADSSTAQALAGLGYSDEAQLAAAISAGEHDDDGENIVSCRQTLVRERLAVAHPGYDRT